MNKPLLLIILDGWGYREETENNAVALARTPNYDRFLKEYPHTVIDASGHAVGLPAGVMGNSEVGHLNIGAGRIVFVGLTRIYSAIEDGSFFQLPMIRAAFEATKKNRSTLHLMGLVSDGGVHSHEDHLFALLDMARREQVARVAVHAFTDGRDTPPTSGIGYLQTLETKLREYAVGQIATVMGRYYAMDRDKRWDRTERAYDAMVLGAGEKTADWEKSVRAAYARGETDEFLQPLTLLNERGEPRAMIQDEDAVIFFNFRADRARQLTYALTNESFSGFARKRVPRLSSFVCFGEYDKNLKLPVAFPPVHLRHILPEELSRRDLKQLRVAETEKYAHVTFFFNGGEEAVFPGESRRLVPSPREVATYDLKPEMSAPAVGDEVVRAIEQEDFALIVCNFANADMVGHTGVLPAAIRAVETVDEQLGRIDKALKKKGGTMLVTADHGNCEQMADEKGNPHTAHTTDLVPFILIGENWKRAHLRSGGTLADIAPTILKILNFPQPQEMTGRSLIQS